MSERALQLNEHLHIPGEGAARCIHEAEASGTVSIDEKQFQRLNELALTYGISPLTSQR